MAGKRKMPGVLWVSVAALVVMAQANLMGWVMKSHCVGLAVCGIDLVLVIGAIGGFRWAYWGTMFLVFGGMIYALFTGTMQSILLSIVLDAFLFVPVYWKRKYFNNGSLSGYIVLMVTAGCIIAPIAGLLYIGHKAWERSWVMAESIQGPDGYTYGLMHETGFTLDPGIKLVRAKYFSDENSYEELGSIIEGSSRLSVIRSIDIAEGPKRKLLLSSNGSIFFVTRHQTHFIYDSVNNQFYEEPNNNTMSPFILIDDVNAELFKPDVAWVLERVVKDYQSYVDQKEYVADYFKDANAPAKFGVDKYVPEWPTREALDAGLAHPNKEVQKIAGWLLYVQQNGLEEDCEITRQIKAFLNDGRILIGAK